MNVFEISTWQSMCMTCSQAFFFSLSLSSPLYVCNSPISISFPQTFFSNTFLPLPHPIFTLPLHSSVDFWGNPFPFRYTFSLWGSIKHPILPFPTAVSPYYNSSPAPGPAVCTAVGRSPWTSIWGCSCPRCSTRPPQSRWIASSCPPGTWRSSAPTLRLRWAMVKNKPTNSPNLGPFCTKQHLAC